ncbi:tetratricopeptide repeat-containing sulfotransferase family protein [Phenylobacterium sp.]|uniref:tetratricopeptide repeat-containing sulfotransferase family protein n=1 Tax=Phenylobacterium sp. TaxID=1871053 RepID=UPI0025F7889E|nr:tetratricopeptide repeat-containing sulfotransferase family protein [Phenylobacterium sp.]
MSNWKVGQIKVKVGAYTPAPSAKVTVATGPAAPSVVVPAPPAARDPDADLARLAEIQAAVKAEDYDRASDLADEALKSGLEHSLVLNLAALKREDEGRYDEALATLARAIALDPRDIGARNAAGLVLARVERYADALAMFDGVVAIQPAFAGAHCARGTALEALGRLKEAEVAYKHTLDLQPQNLGALQGLANLLSRRGAHAQARPLAETVLAAEPNFPDAVMVLAAADAAEGAGERAERRLELLAADARLTPQQRALAQGLLGDVLDAQDRPADAFQAYAACNMGLFRAYAPVHDQGIGALEFSRGMLEELAAIPASAWTSAAAPRADGPKTHVFLLGFPRSGTTLLEQVLASHPDVEALEERETLLDATRAFLRQPSDLGRLAVAREAELAPLRDAYWAKVRAEGAEPAGKVFVDKHPLNTFRLPLILKLFPDAKILFARRDPRDVVLSCYRRRFAMSGSAYQLLTLPGAAGYYDAAMRIAELVEPAMGPRTHVVRHEALVDGFDTVVGEVCAALGLPWVEAMRNFADQARDRAVATPSGAQLSRGLSAEGVGAWRRYRDQLAPVLPTLEPWVTRFGYSAT